MPFFFYKDLILCEYSLAGLLLLFSKLSLKGVIEEIYLQCFMQKVPIYFMMKAGGVQVLDRLQDLHMALIQPNQGGSKFCKTL